MLVVGEVLRSELGLSPPRRAVIVDADLALALGDVAVQIGERAGALCLLARPVCVLQVLADLLGDVGVALVLFGRGLVGPRGALGRLGRSLAGSLDSS